MLIGHSQLVKDFKNLVKNGRLAHGYIFYGEPEVGKFYLTTYVANLIESGVWDVPTRPLQDALILENVSGIDDMRRIKNFLWQKPAVSSKRLVVVNDAQNLTPQAQNAILKITEEPPENVMLILIANQLDNILPPLLSRLQKIYFGRLSDAEMRELVKFSTGGGSASGGKVNEIENSFGRPGRLARLSGDKNMAEIEKYAEQFLKSSGPVRSKLIKEMVDIQKELAEESPDGKSDFLDRFFESLILILRKDPIRNVKIIKDVMHRLFLIKSYNVNKRLQLEAVSESALQMRTSE